MTRAIAVLAVAAALCAPPAGAQGTGTKTKADASAPAAKTAPQGAKSTGKAIEAPAPGKSQGAKDTQMSLQREVFRYDDGGRRDPMVSLMNTSDLRPLITEVQVVGIIYDEEGMNHVAILRNTVDKKTQYHVKLGQMLGRMKVTQITRREVVFTIDEFGFSRQERLSVKPDTTAKRTP